MTERQAEHDTARQTTTAIFWDFGGVFTTSPFEAFNRYEAAEGLPRDFIRTVNATNPEDNAWAKFESSRISTDEFDELFASESDALGHRIPGSAVLPLLSGTLRPRMVNVLKACKAHYTVACLTNNIKTGAGPGMAGDAKRASAFAEVMALFDHVVQSSVEGVRKPEQAFYELACARAGVTPAEVIFLDDLGVNLKTARAMGMRTIKVLNEAQAIADLAALTGLDFP